MVDVYASGKNISRSEAVRQLLMRALGNLKGKTNVANSPSNKNETKFSVRTRGKSAPGTRKGDLIHTDYDDRSRKWTNVSRKKKPADVEPPK